MNTYINEHGEVVAGHFLRTPYNYDTNEASDETGLACPEETKAQQQFKDDADINVIMERFGVTGEMPNNVRMPTSGDFTNNVTDFQSAMNLTIQAREEFMTLPAKARARFDNDPQKFMTFMEDKENFDEIVKLGLATIRPVKTPEVKKEEEEKKD